MSPELHLTAVAMEVVILRSHTRLYAKGICELSYRTIGWGCRSNGEVWLEGFKALAYG